MPWWKGSGGGSSAPMPQQQSGSADQSMMMMAMLAKMIGAMSEAQQPRMPAPLQMPEVRKVEPIDWTEKTSQLAAKARGDYAVDQRRRKGHADTIHTSPLLDDEEVSTTQNLIS